jgi:hydrophobic/amphiphilic exporter-1 (mainly G- bacteria), HAE1 family
MGLTRTAIKRPLATVMVFLALILMGQQAYTRLQVDRFPKVSFPTVFAQIGWPGASPQDIEQAILIPAENAVAGISGVQRVDSAAQEGLGRINVYFVEGTDVDRGAIDVQRRLAAIGRFLPVDATQPSVTKADPSSAPVLNIVLTGQRSLDDLYDIAVDRVQPKLQVVPGVADVSIAGGWQREIQIQVDYAKLEGYGLSLAQISNAVQRENINSPGGRVDVGEHTYSIRAIGLAQKPEELGDFVVASSPRGAIRLRDVATIEVSYKQPTNVLRYSAHERGSIDAVGLTITKQTDANTLDVADRVRESLQQLRRTLPAGVEVIITNDTSRYVHRAVDAVQKDLVLAILITAVVLYLFLHTWRSTLIVLISIPTCLVTTFLLMYALGFSLNTISLMAMALMIGILVDDSIVVLENISRHLSLGENPMVAALKGRSEIGLAAISITLTDVIVYVPMSFMQGNIGKLFREFGLTIAVATLLSLLVSFTLVPVLASRWLRPHRADAQQRGFAGMWEQGFNRLGRAYGRLLGWSLHHRPVVVAVAVATLVASFLPLQFHWIGQEYTPNEDDGQFTINAEMPPGTSLAGTGAAVARVEQTLLQLPEVEAFTTTLGPSGDHAHGTSRNGLIEVQLVEKTQRQRSVFAVMQDVRRVQGEIPGMRLRTNIQSPLIGGGFGPPINVRLFGDNIRTLEQLAEQVEALVRETPGTVDVRNDANVAEPEIRAYVERQRLADLGVTASQIAAALRTSIGGTAVTQLRVEGQLGIDITVVANRDLRNDLTRIADIPLPTGTTDGGQIVRLGQVADLRVANAATSIARSDRQRQVSVQASLVNRSVGDAARDIRAGLDRVPMPSGYRSTFVGQVDQLDQARVALLSALTISVLLIYMLLVALYESWLHPLAIMFSLPVALVGAFGALLITGNTFNLFSMIGIIMLMGLVAKNAILLVDFTNTLRAGGLSPKLALLQAVPVRLRPIIMTTATVVFAMIPLALKLEEGAETRAPMALVLIGGTVTSTLLTLVLVPVMYTYLDDLSRLPAVAWARVPRWLRLRRESSGPAAVGASNGYGSDTARTRSPLRPRRRIRRSARGL